MFKNIKQGWYKIKNPGKWIHQIDDHMKSYKDGSVNYKSGLELKAIKYCDLNKHIVKWSLEPFNIKYIKPTDGKEHRYYIDFFIEFSSGDKFLVEVKSKAETKPPKPPDSISSKKIVNYKKALITYQVNKAKWAAAEEFAKQNNMRFIIITDDELK